MDRIVERIAKGMTPTDTRRGFLRQVGALGVAMAAGLIGGSIAMAKVAKKKKAKKKVAKKKKAVKKRGRGSERVGCVYSCDRDDRDSSVTVRTMQFDGDCPSTISNVGRCSQCDLVEQITSEHGASDIRPSISACHSAAKKRTKKKAKKKVAKKKKATKKKVR